MELKLVLYYFIKLIDLYSLLIVISILGSWIDRNREINVLNVIRKLTDPYLKLFKIIVPLGGMYFDLSPIIAIFLLNLLEQVLYKLIY